MLKNLVVEIQNDSNWAVYADSNDPEAPARYGQRQFENGGVLDGKHFVIDGQMAAQALMSYTDGDPAWLDEHGDREEFLQWMIDEGYIK